MSKILSYILWGTVYLISLLPLKVHYWISDFMAFFLRKIIAYRQYAIFINLSRSFPDLEYHRLRALAKEYYRYMCDIMMESIWCVSASEKQICRIVKTANPELMDDICARHNKVVVVLGHRGNWELIGGMCGENGKRSPDSFSAHNIMLVYKAAENQAFDLLFRKMRMHQFAKFCNPGGVIESRRIIRHIMKDERERSVYMLIADQSPVPGEKILTRFLNQPTFMITGPEYISRRLDLPVVYLDMERESRGSYTIRFSLITENPGETEPGFITKEYARLLEHGICKGKYNWLWSHKRWKRVLTREERERYREEYDNDFPIEECA